MKRIITIIIVLLMLTGLTGCEDESKNTNASSSTSYNSSAKTLTRSEIESRAATAVYKELEKRYSSKYDISQTTWNVGSVQQKDTSTWTVKGTFSLYDDYGRFKKSGTFTAYVSTYGSDFAVMSLN